MDLKIADIKNHLPAFLEKLDSWNSECLRTYLSLEYKEADLRKSVFSKFFLLFTNMALHVELLKENALEEILEQRKKNHIKVIGIDYRENFLKFTLRSLYSEAFELIEHLMVSVLDAAQVKKDPKKYIPISLIIKGEVYQGKMQDSFKSKFKEDFFANILNEKEKAFLLNFADKYRNPRHNNYKGMTFIFSDNNNWSEFTDLIVVAQKIVYNDRVKRLSFVEDHIPR